MISLLVAAFLFFACFGTGRALLLRLGLFEEDDEALAFSAAFGLGLLAYGVLLLGLTHTLSPAGILGLLAAFAVFAVIRARENFRAFRNALRDLRSPMSALDRLLAALALAALGAALLGSLAPETSHDSLAYHLHVPKLFLTQRWVGPIAFEVNSLFPFLMEMLDTIALALNLPALAPLFHYGLTALAAIAMVSFLRKKTGLSAAWISAIFFITTPGILNQLATAYVDAALAAWTVFAVIGFMRWRETGRPGWLFLSGALIGCAMSTKFLGALSALILGVLAVWTALKRKKLGKDITAVGLYGASAFVFSAYWYVRSYLHHGNPVYPYFYKIFGAGDPTIHYSDIGVGKGLGALFLLPWSLVMNPHRFEGFGVQIGPAYLAFLIPAFFALRTAGRWTRPLLFFCGAYTLTWFFLGQSLRFYFPVLPVLAMVIASGLPLVLKPDALGRIYRGLIVFVLALHAGLGFYHYRHSFMVALGMESRAHYLKKMERTYEAAQYVNQRLPRSAKILTADEVRAFYFQRPVVRESVYARDTRYFEHAKGPEEVLQYLQNDGFTHVLHVQGPVTPSAEVLEEGRIGRLIAQDQQVMLYLETLLTYTFTNPDGSSSRFTLYEIKDRPH